MASPQQEEELDPRIQEELERLNRAADEINSLELELDDSRASFRQLLTESTQRLNMLAKKLGSCVDRARPYYQARREAKEAQIETQKAVQRFDRATSMHNAAKEMVAVAENGLLKEGHTFDTTWQEMLNHATTKVNEAEKERFVSELAHQATARKFNESEQRVKMLQKALKRAIVKSRPYFEMKAKIQEDLDERKQRVERLEKGVVNSKSEYSVALKNLEEISEGIHRQRRERRGSGVGAEAGSPESREDPQGVGDTVHLPPSVSVQGVGDAETAVQKDKHENNVTEKDNVDDESGERVARENLTSQEKSLGTSPVTAGPSVSSPAVSCLSDGIVLSPPRNVEPIRIKLQFSPEPANKVSKDSGIADDSVLLHDNRSMEGYAYGISPPKSHSSPGISSSLQRPGSSPLMYAPRSHSGILGNEYKTLPNTHSGTGAGSPLRPKRGAAKSLDLTESDDGPLDDGSIFTSADLLAIKADLERKDSMESLTETGSVSSLSDGVGMGMSLSLSRLSLRLRERSDSI